MFRKNTASQFIHFQGVDSTTGGIKSGVTWTIRRYIDGTAAAGGGTVTEDGTTGWYKYAMSQADTNGNNIGFNFTGTGAIPQTMNIVTTACDPTTATNFGITALPAVASGSAGAVLIDGTGTAAISNSSGRVDIGKALGTAVTLDANNVLNVSTKYVGGTLQTARDIGLSVLLASGQKVDVDTIKTNPVVNGGTFTFPTNATGASTTNITAATGVDTTKWAGGTIPAVNVTGVPLVDLKYTLGTISPATPGSVRTDLVTNSVSTSGTAQAGSVNTITLAAGASAVNGTYDPSIVRLTGGTGVGQARLILDYNGTSKVCTVDRDWRTNPDATTTYDILPSTNLVSTNEGLATGGAASTITLNSSASAVNDTYKGQIIVIRTGLGQDQSRIITTYVGATKVATVDAAWATNPDTTSGYMIMQSSRMDATISSRMATYTQPTGFLAATFPTTVAATGDAMALTSGERNSTADAMLDRAAGVETGITPRQGLRLMLATMVGKLSGAATTSIAIRDTNDTKNRISATVDSSGNRSAVTLDAS